MSNTALARDYRPVLAALVAAYLAAVDVVFATLRTHLDRGTITSALRGPVAHAGFSRLT